MIENKLGSPVTTTIATTDFALVVINLDGSRVLIADTSTKDARDMALETWVDWTGLYPTQQWGFVYFVGDEVRAEGSDQETINVTVDLLRAYIDTQDPVFMCIENS